MGAERAVWPRADLTMGAPLSLVQHKARIGTTYVTPAAIPHKPTFFAQSAFPPCLRTNSETHNSFPTSS